MVKKALVRMKALRKRRSMLFFRRTRSCRLLNCTAVCCQSWLNLLPLIWMDLRLNQASLAPYPKLDFLCIVNPKKFQFSWQIFSFFPSLLIYDTFPFDVFCLSWAIKGALGFCFDGAVCK